MLRAAASAFVRGFLDEVFVGSGLAGEDKPVPTPDPLRSEAAERVLGPIATVKLFRFWLEISVGRGGLGIKSGSGGSSAAGIASPRAAATS